MSKRVELENLLLTHIRDAGLPEPAREYHFNEARQWRFDFAYPGYQIAIEVEGGIWVRGRHTRPKGYTDDCEKYNNAALTGWMVLRFTTDMIKSGTAIDLIKIALSEVNA